MAEEELVEQQELFEHYRFKVDPGQSLLRIDKFLAARIKMFRAPGSRMLQTQAISW